jgi:hypothetical protein
VIRGGVKSGRDTKPSLAGRTLLRLAGGLPALLPAMSWHPLAPSPAALAADVPASTKKLLRV